MVEAYKVLWDQNALNQLADIYAYIFEESYQKAETVKHKILALTAGLATNPKRYKPDKLRLDNNPDFRACEIYKFRITFYISDNMTVNVLRIRSIRQEPLLY